MTPDEIRDVLRKRNLKVIEHINRVRHVQGQGGSRGSRGRVYDNYYIVIWVDKNKIKYGHINQDYTHRYGIDVRATLDNGRFWFKSNDIAQEIPEKHLDLMMLLDGDEPIILKDFDPGSINVSW